MPIIASDGSAIYPKKDDGKDAAKGPGGWGVSILFEADHPIAPGFRDEIFSGSKSTTVGEMEARGLENALRAVQQLRRALLTDPDNALITPRCRFRIICDSQYVVAGYTEHLSLWRENNWRSAGSRAIKHQVIWQEISELRDEVGNWVSVEWTKGHATDDSIETLMNNLADRAASRMFHSIRDTGYVPTPQQRLWRHHQEASLRREADIAMLQMLTERVLRDHGRAPVVEAYRKATHATGIID